MKGKVLLVGEPMGLFIAQNEGPLEDVTGYSFAIAGAEFNVAVGLTRLGHEVEYVTKLGDDPFGKHIIKFMAENGIASDRILVTGARRTGFMLKGMTAKGDPQIFYFRAGSAASTLSPDDLRALDFSQYSNIHLTGITPALSQECRDTCRFLAQKAHENGIFLSFDPNLRPQLWPNAQAMADFMNTFSGECDLVLPGIAEGRLLSGRQTPEEIAEFYRARGAGTVIVKTGGEGAYYASPEGCGRVAGFPVKKIVDTVGAGDGFAAGVLSARREGLSWPESVRRGNAVGAIQVMSRGDNDGLPTREELFAYMIL